MENNVINDDGNIQQAAEVLCEGQPLQQPLGEKLAAVLPSDWKGRDE